MRRASFILLLFLAGCSGSAASRLGMGQPGLDVARAALRGGSPRVALQVANGLLSKNPQDIDALIIQGDALTTLGHLDDATKSFTTALALDPTSVQGHIGLGRIRLATNPAAAEALFLQALQHDPRNTTALNDLGIARDLLGNHTGAQRAYSRALGIDPDSHASQVNLALSLAMSGHANRAQRLLQPLASEPGASRKLRHDLAAVLAMGGNQAEAKRILSADLSPEEVQQALQDFVEARSDGAHATSLMATGGSVAARPAVLHRHQAATGIQVQFAANPSKADAKAVWQRMQQRMPQLLADRQPIYLQAAHDGGDVWRLRTDGFATTGKAEAFCTKVRAAGAACEVVRAGPAGE